MSPRRSKAPVAKSNISLPNREAIMNLLVTQSAPMRLSLIANHFKVTESSHLTALRRRLSKMVRDGQVIKNRRGSYGAIAKMDMVTGQVIAHPDGYGFLKSDDGGADLFLHYRQMRSLLHGDRAVVRVINVDQSGRRQGVLVEVLQRANKRIVGRFYGEGKGGYIVPDNKRLRDVMIESDESVKATDGQFVIADLIRQPDKHVPPLGKVVEVIDNEMSPNLAVEIAIHAHDLPYQFSEAVQTELSAIDSKVDINQLPNREDIRAWDLVTIDGADARDFDDAVYCEKDTEGWRLYVAIADVAHYVRPKGALDKEARKRGTSVYFPQRVIPMLPERLSNELCSLQPDEDRFSLVCELLINDDGSPREHRFFPAVIRSSARLTYDEMAAITVERDAGTRAQYPHLLSPLDRLHALYEIMRGYRESRALVEFSSTEVKFEFDEQVEIIELVKVQRNDAHRLVEEFMLAANIAAGAYLEERNVPTLYRVHDSPSFEKLSEVLAFIQPLGINMDKPDKPSISDYAALLENAKSRPDAHVINRLLLRSMPLALYSVDNIGHFGLGFDVYAHFTSPIRRYPDLLLHRAIYHTLDSTGNSAYAREELVKLGETCSITERRAESASRDAVQRMKCIYVHQYISQAKQPMVFTGLVSSVTSFGLFIEIDAICVEGLLHISSLPTDYYHYDSAQHCLRGESTGQTFHLGAVLQVAIANVDIDKKQIDLELLS